MSTIKARMTDFDVDVLDLRPFSCPKPLIETKLWLKSARLNDRVTVQLSDPGSIHDVPKYINSQDKFSMVLKVRKGYTEILVTKISESASDKLTGEGKQND